MRILSSATALYLGLTSLCLASQAQEDPILHKPTQPVEINHDYNPAQFIPVAPGKDMKSIKLLEPVTQMENYKGNKGKKIPLTAPVPEKPVGFAKQVLQNVGYGLYKIGEHTVRITLGCISNHYLNDAASLAFGQVAYTITISLTGNPFIANFMYAFGANTCKPIIASLVFYTGSRSLDIVYYVGKTVYKTVQLSAEAATILIQGAQWSAECINKLMKSEKSVNKMIEMVALYDPNMTDQTKGK